MQAFEEQGYQLYGTSDDNNVESYVRDGYAIAGRDSSPARPKGGTQHTADYAAFAKDVNQGNVAYTTRGTLVQQQYVSVSPYVRSALTPTSLFVSSPRYYDAASPRYYEQPVYAVSRPPRCLRANTVNPRPLPAASWPASLRSASVCDGRDACCSRGTPPSAPYRFRRSRACRRIPWRRSRTLPAPLSVRVRCAVCLRLRCPATPVQRLRCPLPPLRVATKHT